MATLPDIGVNIAYGMEESPNFSVRAISYGDGFEQRAPNGINSVRGSWAVSWEQLTEAQKKMLMDFFKDMKGVYSFTWKHPTEKVDYVVTCSDPKATYTTFNRWTVKATLKEAFL